MVTAYCWTGSRMADGQWPFVGAAAGTVELKNRKARFYVPGWGTVTVLDVVGYHPADHLDLYMASCGEAQNWGVRTESVKELN